MNKQGIVLAGNWIVDSVKCIDHFPLEERLANVISELKSNGGSPFNVGIDLWKLGNTEPIYALGEIGDDSNGKWIAERLHEKGINTSQLKQGGSLTSYTDVFVNSTNNKRTFFHYRGANANFFIDKLPTQFLHARHLHYGYLMLLDKMDELEGGETGAYKLLKSAKEAGLTTSVDLVSESKNRFDTGVKMALKAVDYLFLNEYECQCLTDVAIGNQVDIEQEMRVASQKLFELGVNKAIFLHMKEGALYASRSGDFVFQQSLDIPQSLIKSNSGAGDAFAAGILLSLALENDPIDQLRLGVACAASSLLHEGCSEGVKPKADCLSMFDQYPLQNNYESLIFS